MAGDHTQSGCERAGDILQVVAALLLLKALTAGGAGNGAVLLQPSLEGLVMWLILQPAKSEDLTH